MRDEPLQVEYRPIPGAPNYGATVEGKIINLRTGRSLKSWLAGGDGSLRLYPYVQLGLHGPKAAVHRFVALAWLGPCPSEHEVSHEDGDSLNSRPSNLTWKTHAENEQQKRKHGRYARPINYGKPGQKKRGPKPRPHQKLEQMLELRTAGRTFTEVSAMLELPRSTIADAIRRFRRLRGGVVTLGEGGPTFDAVQAERAADG